MKVKKGQLVDIWNTLSQLGEGNLPVKFAYMIARNRKLIEPEIMALKEVQDRIPDNASVEDRQQFVDVLNQEVSINFIKCLQADLPKEISPNMLTTIIELIE